MIRNRLTWLNTVVVEPYFLFHFLSFFSYLPLRLSAAAVLSSAASVLSSATATRLLRREIQALLAFALLTSIKMVREETIEGFIADALLFGKVFLLVIAFYMDYRLALWYIMVFLVIDILVQQPAFPELGSVNTLTPLQLETSLAESVASKFWLVEFRALYSSTCVRYSRIFPELSITYSNKNLSFGVVDLGLFPNVAEKFGISLTGSTSLPTYILFQGNTEVTRFPEVDFGAKSYNPPISKKNLSQHFDLDLLLLEYVNGK